MEKNEFEKRFLSLVNQTNVAITPSNVAYHLSIPIEEAQEHLLSLELNGVIQQQTDQDGGTVYAMPNRPAAGTLPAQLDGQAGRSEGAPPGIHNPADLPPAPILSGPEHAPAKGMAINGLVLNILIPGVGSIVCGRMIGIAMLMLLVLGIVSVFILPGFTKFLAILPIIASWIWSIIAGIGLLSMKEKPR